MTLIIGHLLGIYVNLTARFNTFMLKRGHCICGKLIHIKKGEEIPLCPKHGRILYSYPETKQ